MTAYLNANAIKEMADQVDCIFFFLILPYHGENKQINANIEESICRHVGDKIGANFYACRSGPGIFYISGLREETRLLIPEQVNFILVDIENDVVSLLSQQQRDEIIESLQTNEFNGNELSAVIVQQICNQTESKI